MPTIFVPAKPYPKKANDNIRSSDWNAAINEVSRLSVTTQNLDRGTFNGPLTISGALTASAGLTVTGNQTVNGALTVNGVLGVSTYTRISQQTSGNWAIFGANMYNTGSGFKLVNSAQPGANLHMSAEGGGTTQFRFCLMDAGETNQRNIATIGTGGLTVTGDETVSGKLTVNGTALSELKGPVTVSGLLTASNGLTVSGALTANGGINGPLTVTGALTVNGVLGVSTYTRISQTAGENWAIFGANMYYSGSAWKLVDSAKPGANLHISAQPNAAGTQFRFGLMDAGETNQRNIATIGTGGLTVNGGITAPLTITGAVENALTIEGSLVKVRGVTTIGTDTYWSWSSFGCNLWARGNNDWQSVNPSQPGVCLYMGGTSTFDKEFRFVRVDANLANRQELASIGTGGLTVAGGINGPITVKGVLKVGSTSGMLEVGSLTIISQNTTGSWACFGKNFYLSENGSWLLKDTSKPGVNLHMSADGAANQEFRFARREANSNVNVHLATIGTEGIVSNGKKVATGHEFLYMIRGMVNANGTIGAGSGFSVQKQAGLGYYQITFDAAFSSLPIAVATQYWPDNSNTLDNAVIVGLATTFIRIKVGTGSGALADRNFTFIAAGPRTT